MSVRERINAAAVRLDDLTDTKGELVRTMQRYEQWQMLALGFYDTIGEVHYGVTAAADALAKGKLFVGVRDNPDDPLVPVDDEESGVSPRDAEIATAKLREFRSPVGGQAQLVRMMAVNKRVTGEFYLLHYQGVDERLWGWHVRSVDDIKIGDDKVTSKGLGEFTFEEVARVWQPHARKFEAADCGMRAVLGACETVLLCDHQFRAGLRSRLFRGLMLLANGFRSTTADSASETAGDGEAQDDPLVQDLVTALVTGIQQEGTASAMVPNILYGAREDVKDGWALIDFGVQVDPHVMELRTDSIRRIAQGIDEPAEIITGMGDINHWGQWFIGESFVQHIEPDAEFIADAATTVFLRPELEADGLISPDLLERLEVGMDLSPLMRRPNGDEDARNAYDRGELSGAGLRHALGIGEEWAPEELDTLRYMLLKATPGPNLLDTLIRMVVAPDLPAVASDTQAPAIMPAPGGQTGPPIAASAGAGQLVDIDRAVTERLYAALLTTLRRALERAGNRARARVSASYRPRSLDVPADQVVAHVGPAVLAAASVTDAELLDGAMEQLQPDFDRWVRDAQKAALLAALLLVSQESDEEPDPADLEDFRSRQEADRASAWEWLSGAGSAVLAEHLHSGKPVSDWEARALARQSLARAGGANTLASTTSGTSAEAIPEGAGAGLATGAAIVGLLGSLGAAVTSWEWEHGEPDHPFPDHVDLNGRVEKAPDDFDGFYPGDHDGCLPAGVVVSGPAATGATLRWFEGDLVEVSLASGQLLPATPNHPVLTRRGWVGAGLLEEGDEVVRCRGDEGIAGLVPDDRQVPAPIEDVIAALGVSEAMSARRVPVAPEQFHGDGIGSEVCVVWTDRSLRDGGEAPLVEPEGQLLLPRGGEHAAPLTGESSTAQRFEGVGNAPFGSVSGLDIGQSLLRRPPAEGDALGLAGSSSHDAGLVQPEVDGTALYAEALGQSEDRLASLVEFDKVLAVDVHPFAGHVHNLQTEPGWYLANGIVVHNCTCELVPVFGGTE